MKRLKEDSGKAIHLHPRAEADQGNVGSTAGRAPPHPELLHYSRQHQPECQNAYIDLMADVMERGADLAPLHLKIA